MLDLQAETIKLANQFKRRCGATANDAHRRIEFPSAGIFLQCFQDSNPNCGNTAGDGYTFVYQQVENAFGIDIGARENETRAEHRARVRKAPRVSVEHGS